VNIGRIDIGVANDPNSLDRLQLVRCQPQQARLKITGDAIIRDRVLQTIREERVVKTLATGAETVNAHIRDHVAFGGICPERILVSK
jgi:hypothetical protein